MLVANKTGLAKTSARPGSTLRIFSSYDANILGGLMIGTGMALTHACPGTVLAQVGTGVPGGLGTLAGCMIGALSYSKIAEAFQSRYRRAMVEQDASGPPAALSIPASGASSHSIAVLAFASACGLVAASVHHLHLDKILHSTAIRGGLLIGLSQLFSLIVRRKSLGASQGYAAMAQLFIRWAGFGSGKSSPKDKPEQIPIDNLPIFFSLGVLGGAFVTASIGTASTALSIPSDTTSLVRSIFGGAIMIFGARLAGGCTSGHGLSGMASLGVSSFISIASMFAGGMLLARFV